MIDIIYDIFEYLFPDELPLPHFNATKHNTFVLDWSPLDFQVVIDYTHNILIINHKPFPFNTRSIITMIECLNETIHDGVTLYNGIPK